MASREDNNAKNSSARGIYGIIPTSIKLDPVLKDRVKKLGKIKQRTPHAIMKEAICLYLEREEKIECLTQQITARWQARADKPLISHSSTCAWLATWGTSKENEEAVWQK